MKLSGLLKKIQSGNTLYYPGCLTKFVATDIAENYRTILQKGGIDVIELVEAEMCCGSPVLSAGFDKDFEELALKNLKIFKEHAIAKIITSCPACYKMFKKDYARFLGVQWDIGVEHATEAIADCISTQKLKVIKLANARTVTYHDPCHLGRHMGIYRQPREILKNLGYDVIEMQLAKEASFCCGGGGGLRANNPDLAKKIAQERFDQAQETKAHILTTSCPMCYIQLKEAHQNKEKDSHIDVKELSELIGERLKN